MADSRIRRIQYLEFIEGRENRKKKCKKERKSDYDELNDYEFLKRYRITKSSFNALLDMIEPKIIQKTHLNNAITPREQLLIALRFYAENSFQTTIGDLIGVSQASVHRIMVRVTEAIASLRPKFISMPETEEECKEVSEKFFRIALFPGVIGAVDCTHIDILSPGGNDAERFRNRKSKFSLNVQTVASAELLIQNVVARWPGSGHDSTILANSSLLDEMKGPLLNKYHLLGDSGYPCQNYLLTPFIQPNSPEEIRYNAAHIKTRNTVERLYGILKSRFPCLASKLRCALENVPSIVIACCVLHNLAVKQGDPHPPIDDAVKNILENFEQESQQHTNITTGTSAGFAKRRLVLQRFFS